MSKYIFLFIFVSFCACNNASDSGDYSTDGLDTSATTATNTSTSTDIDTTSAGVSHDTSYKIGVDTVTTRPIPAIKPNRSSSDNQSPSMPRPIPHIDTSATQVDTSKVSNPEKKRTAILGYSYYKNMKQHETRRISAFVEVNNPASVVINKLEEI